MTNETIKVPNGVAPYFVEIATREREKLERENCEACRERRVHSEEEWRKHPFAGSRGRHADS